MVGEVWLGRKIDIFARIIPISLPNEAAEQAKSRVSVRRYPTFALVCDNFFSVITLHNRAIYFAYATLRANNCRSEQKLANLPLHPPLPVFARKYCTIIINQTLTLPYPYPYPYPHSPERHFADEQAENTRANANIERNAVSKPV